MDPLAIALFGALTGLAGFTGWLAKRYIAFLERQLADSNRRTDRALDEARTAVRGVADLAAELKRQNDAAGAPA